MGNSLVRIPTPKFAIFYNGTREQPERYEMILSDAFLCPVEEPEIELKCTVYNINYGRNEELLEKCPFLRDYMTFVDYVRQIHKELGFDRLEHAIELAIDRCIRENVLRDFLMDHRSEVVKVTTLDYTFERQLELEREEKLTEGRAEGRVEGRSEGEIIKLIRLVLKKRAKNHTVEEIAEILEEDIDTVRKICDAIEEAGTDSVDRIYEVLSGKGMVPCRHDF